MAQIEAKVDKLSTNNYSTWKVIMESQLKGKALWPFVISIKNDEDVDQLFNEQAKALMYLSMDVHQIAATGVCATAYDLWKKIRENHEGAESNLRSSSLAEFLSIKYRKGETIVNFAGRYENSFGKLASTGHVVDEKTKLWVFSNSLPQHLKLTVQMFTMANPEGQVRDLISQLKIQHHLDHNDHDRQGAAYHTEEKTQFSNRKPHPKPMSNSQCNYCKRVGHVWRECRKLKFDNERKKSFGQRNQQNIQNHQRWSEPTPNQNQGYQKRPQNNQRQIQNKPSTGAFNVTRHNFSEGKYTWIVDSGASSHMTPYKEYLVDYEEYETPRKIYQGNGESLQVYGKGRMPFENNEFTGELKKVLWVPELTENLFSIGRAMEQNCSVEFCNEKYMALFYRNNQLVLRAIKKPSTIYFLLTLKPLHIGSQHNDGALVGASYEDWHKRLGHCSMETVKALIQSDAVRGLKISNTQQHECRACIMGKLCRAHHPQRGHTKASETAAVLNIDTVGPMKTTSVGGSRYFVLATEDYSGYKLFETLGSKAEIPEALKRIINQAELTSGRPVKEILTDNGTEFTNVNFNNWLNKRGIIHSYSATYTPQQNGRAERANRTVLNGIRTLLIDSNLPEELWAEALSTVVYTTNRLPGNNKTKTRYELFIGEKPDISNLKIFGQGAIIRESDNARDGKLAPLGEIAIFVGYTNRHNTYRFYIEKPVQQIIVSCDVRFTNELPSAHKQAEREQYVVVLRDDDSDDDKTETDETEIDEGSYRTADPDSGTEPDSPSDDENDTTIVPKLETESLPTIEPRVTRSQTRAQATEDQSDNISTVAIHEGAMFTLDDEPRTFKDAQESDDWPNWQQAMNEEIEALEKNRTWVLVDKPNNIKPIKNKWVYKAKLKQDGSIERFKARLVAKGFTQIANVDYKETYAPVASMTTVRMLLAIANQNSMHIVQFDIKTAFLYGDLEEELYMEQPENYIKEPNKVCKLVKSLYGLKQAPRQWNKKFDSFLKIFKLEQSRIDRCLYFSHDKSILLAIYVDDGLAAGRDRKQLDHLISYLKDNFELKVMDCESYLGFEIQRDLKAKTLSISQPHYVDKILTRFGMCDSKPASTPEEVGVKFTDSPLLPTDNQFKELVGSLLYLTTCSRPDIAHAVSIASRTAQPTQAHWVALKRVLRYLKGTRDLGIRFRWENPNELIGYSDADYANEVETRKSTTGYCIFFGGGPINWRCQRQPIITLSTTEAEYVAGCELVKEVLPIRQQLIELDQIDEHKPTKIYIDNQSAVKIASSEGGQNRTKHIDIREKWLTEQVMKKKIEVEHISGDEQTADILTKPLYKSKFIANRSKLLTQILSVMAMMAFCASALDGRKLTLTDPLTTVKSERVLIKGDTRYKTINIFMNPCDHLFNYSSSVSASEYLIKYCYEYFERKHFGPLTNCKRQPTIGPDLKQIPLSYNCFDHPNTGHPNIDIHAGKCDVTRRVSRLNSVPEVELDLLQGAWNKHKKLVEQMPTLRRTKRLIPALVALAGMAILGVFTGPAVKTYKLSQSNANGIEQLVNVSNLHTTIINESTTFFEQYRNSVSVLHTWAEEIEEKLGVDPMTSRLNEDPTLRGKKANLIKTYMNWFDTQEKLLLDINMAASHKRIPSSLRNMLNGTNDFDKAANLSTLFECSYRLEDKNMVLDLEFSVPTIDEESEILKILATDVYTSSKNTDDGSEEFCWETYTGPSYSIHNKTTGCIKPLIESKFPQLAIRGQTCREQLPVEGPLNRSENWYQVSCTKELPKIPERIQILDIDGFHKIYCYPYNIELGNEQQPCPNSPFILEGHATYQIENITHDGAYIDTTISRQIRSTNSRKPHTIRRQKRSPMPAMTTVTSHSTTKQANTEAQTTEPLKSKHSSILGNLTRQMDGTIARIQGTLKLIPNKLNITKANFDSFLESPFEQISDGFDAIVDYVKSIGSVVGLLTGLMVFILIMPALELVMIGLKIARIPAGMWLGSARRVMTNLKWASSAGTDKLPKLFRNKRKRWDDSHKMI